MLVSGSVPGCPTAPDPRSIGAGPDEAGAEPGMALVAGIEAFAGGGGVIG